MSQCFWTKMQGGGQITHVKGKSPKILAIINFEKTKGGIITHPTYLVFCHLSICPYLNNLCLCQAANLSDLYSIKTSHSWFLTVEFPISSLFIFRCFHVVIHNSIPILHSSLFFQVKNSLPGGTYRDDIRTKIFPKLTRSANYFYSISLERYTMSSV